MSYLERGYLDPPRHLRLRSGEDHACEELAAALLAKSREGVTALSEKRDFLTSDQLKLREQKEILNSTGTCDESLVSGLFRRAYNPLSVSRPTRRARSED